MKKTFIYIALLVLAMSCSKDEPTPPTPPEPPKPTKVLVANSPEEVAEKLKEAIEIKKQTGEIWTVTTAKGVNYVAGGADWEVLKNTTDEAINAGVILRFPVVEGKEVDGELAEMPDKFFSSTIGSNEANNGSETIAVSSSYGGYPVILVEDLDVRYPFALQDLVNNVPDAVGYSTGYGNVKVVAKRLILSLKEADQYRENGEFANGYNLFPNIATKVYEVWDNVGDPGNPISAKAEVLARIPDYYDAVTIRQEKGPIVLFGFSVDDIYNSTSPKDKRYVATAKFKFENRETAFGPALHVKDGQGLPIELTWELGGTFENGQKDVTCRINYSYDEHQQPNYVAATAAQSVPNARIPMVLPNRVPGENDNSFVEIGDEYYGLVGLEQQLKFAQRVVPGYDDCKYKVTNGKAVVVVPTMNPKQYFGAVATDMTWPDYAWTICHTDTVAMVFVYAPHAFSGKVSSKEEMLKTARVLTSAGDTLSQKAAPIMFVGGKKNSLARICNPCQ